MGAHLASGPRDIRIAHGRGQPAEYADDHAHPWTAARFVRCFVLEHDALEASDLLLTETMLQVEDACWQDHGTKSGHSPRPPRLNVEGPEALTGGAFLPRKYCKWFSHGLRFNIELWGAWGSRVAHGQFTGMVVACIVGGQITCNIVSVNRLKDMFGIRDSQFEGRHFGSRYKNRELLLMRGLRLPGTQRAPRPSENFAR